jgi:hypothetical protein
MATNYLLYPYSSPQNGKAERIIRTVNDTMRTLLLQALMPPSFWAEALALAIHVLNLQPSHTLSMDMPHHKLFNNPQSYSHIRVFGYLSYPNVTATSPNKLHP